jgi:hypothetical protein
LCVPLVVSPCPPPLCCSTTASAPPSHPLPPLIASGDTRLRVCHGLSARGLLRGPGVPWGDVPCPHVRVPQRPGSPVWRLCVFHLSLSSQEAHWAGDVPSFFSRPFHPLPLSWRPVSGMTVCDSRPCPRPPRTTPCCCCSLSPLPVTLCPVRRTLRPALGPAALWTSLLVGGGGGVGGLCRCLVHTPLL